jgi:hypothetical protein
VVDSGHSTSETNREPTHDNEHERRRAHHSHDDTARINEQEKQP